MDDLSAVRLLRALDGTRFRHVEVHAELDSTQTLLAREVARDGRVVVADHQRVGRGRLGRSWAAPPGTALLFSAVVGRQPARRAPLVGLAAGVAVARAIAPVDATLKWPNDVLVGGRKVCGILGELSSDAAAVVCGIGVNVRQSPDDLPPDVAATSLAIEGADVRRDDLCASILRELDVLLPDGSFLAEYRERCATIGSRVRVELDGAVVEDVATDVRDDGALVVGGRAVLAGDVVHVR